MLFLAQVFTAETISGPADQSNINTLRVELVYVCGTYGYQLAEDHWATICKTFQGNNGRGRARAFLV